MRLELVPDSLDTDMEDGTTINLFLSHTHTHKTNKDWENENNAFTMQLSDIKEKLKK